MTTETIERDTAIQEVKENLNKSLKTAIEGIKKDYKQAQIIEVQKD